MSQNTPLNSTLSASASTRAQPGALPAGGVPPRAGVQPTIPWPRHAGAAARRGLAALGAALARAERHITENFRVPPGGG